ncbi:MAG: hypothetical protein PVF43_10175 [Candidatus Eiseniibacteriota bacterium]|jgi:hypothetical protein
MRVGATAAGSGGIRPTAGKVLGMNNGTATSPAPDRSTAMLVIAGLVAGAVAVAMTGGCAPRIANLNLDPLAASGSDAAGRQEWAYDVDGDRRIDFVEVDRDGDGVVDVYYFDTDGDGHYDDVTGPAALEVGDTTAARTFIFFVDGVPQRDLVEMWDEGYFREFHRPAALISPFPSMTYLSFSQMLGTGKPPGYEERYFDTAANALAGGIADHLRADEGHDVTDESFLRIFGYKQPAIYSGLVYIITHYAARKDLANAVAYFDSSAANLAIAYMGTTDGVAHKLGQEGIREILIDIDRILRELIFEHRGRLRIVFASDHGNNYVPSTRIDLGDALQPYGFRLGDAIEDSASVVIPSFGLVGFAAAYLEERRETEFASAAVRIPGVDLAVYETDGVAKVAAAHGRGTARILHDPAANRYAYIPVTGDPLDLHEVVAVLDRSGRLDADGYASDADWFELTRDHRYTDAVRRVHEAATNQVENRANVLLSFDEPFFYGSRLFDLIVDLAGTHGNLAAPSTLGFVMCNYLEPPAFLRTTAMRRCLALPPPR